ncbi:MAG TPA: glycine C-acetyltransferase [Gammaproteobacteria bacterium]
MSKLDRRLQATLQELRSAGTYKVLRNITAPMAPTTVIDGVGEVLVFCSNNYLGLANHPEVVAAGIASLEKYGGGTASVRFICGSFECHRALEEKIANFLGTEAAVTFTSCWNANEGLLPAIAQPDDAIVSDELNHASIIDAGRLSSATRKVYAHSDMAELNTALDEVGDSAVKLVITDGVFSMEGDIAKLPQMREICDKRDATLIVDDSHGTGVLGASGRGTHEHLGLPCGSADGVDIITGTFGKALGGGNGGFVAGSRHLVDYLVQRSRPQLFSNALAPATASSALKALEILEREPERVSILHRNVAKIRSGLRDLGYEVMESPTGIIPIMIGDTADAIRMSDRLLEMGIFVIGFGFPVVPEGRARLRVQMSAAHTDEQIERGLEAFDKVRPPA